MEVILSRQKREQMADEVQAGRVLPADDRDMAAAILRGEELPSAAVARGARDDLIAAFCAKWLPGKGAWPQAGLFLDQIRRYRDRGRWRDTSHASANPHAHDSVEHDLWELFQIADPQTIPESEQAIYFILKRKKLKRGFAI